MYDPSANHSSNIGDRNRNTTHPGISGDTECVSADAADFPMLNAQVAPQNALENVNYQDLEYQVACDFLDLDQRCPSVDGLKLRDGIGTRGYLPHQVAVYWLIRKQIIKPVPGLILNDFYDSRKLAIDLAFSWQVSKLNGSFEKYLHYPGIANRNNRPTLLIYAAEMVNGVIQKFKDNLEYD